MPLPKSISPHPIHPQLSVPLCPGEAFHQLQHDRGRKDTDPLFDMTFGYDIPLATDTVKKLQELDGDNNIFIIIAHDVFVAHEVPHFPFSLNSWKAKGFGEATKWSFLKNLEAFWKKHGIV